MSTDFSVMVKPHGTFCHLSCPHCCCPDTEEPFPSSDLRMPGAVLESFTRQYIAAHPGPEIVFAWQGGEPLWMGLDFFEQAVALQHRYCPPGKFISNVLQTNATLVGEEWADFFQRNRFSVSVCLDGPPAVRNLSLHPKGEPANFERIWAGLRCLQRYGVHLTLLAPIHAANQYSPLEVYRFLRDEADARFIRFVPLVEQRDEGGVSERSVNARQYGGFLSAVFDEWILHDVGRVFVQTFDLALGIWLGYPPDLCIFSEICGKGLALEHNGDLYTYTPYVEPGYRLGNVCETPLLNLVYSASERHPDRSRPATLLRQCTECPVLFACRGECVQDASPLSEGGASEVSYLCEGYRAFLAYATPQIRQMAHTIQGRHY